MTTPAQEGAAVPVLSATDLSVRLGGVPVLRQVGLTLAAGEAVALLGGNGSGKTTLVRSLVGLTPVSRGEVRLFGTPLGRFRDWARVGYVPQRSTASLGGAKVREVVSSGRLAHRRPFVPAGRHDREAVAEAIAAVDLTARAGDEMAHLSGGQQQRVLIARALAGRPELLVLDEPTAGVDLEHQQVLAQLLRHLLGEGTAVLVVLHEVAALASLVDRALVLREGRVVHDGTLQGLGPDLGADGRTGHEHDRPETRRRLLEDSLVDRARQGASWSS